MQDDELDVRPLRGREGSEAEIHQNGLRYRQQRAHTAKSGYIRTAMTRACLAKSGYIGHRRWRGRALTVRYQQDMTLEGRLVFLQASA